MRLTARQLNRATLDRQLLLERGRLDVVDAVRRVVALQAQEPPSPYVALWNRIEDFDARELDTAFATHAVVKASLLRLTLHAVTADDYPVFHSAMLPSLRASRLNDRRFRATGLTTADADAIVAELLEHAGQPRTGVELEALVTQRFGVLPKPGGWWALRMFSRVLHHPTGGPWSFGLRPSYAAARHQDRLDHAESVRRLVARYLEGFGPANPLDVSQFTLLGRPLVRTAIKELGDAVVQLEGPDGSVLFDVPAGTVPDDDVPAPPRLMAMWDSVLLAYADRSRLIPPDYRRAVIQGNGDVLPTLLVDGQVAGVWRPVDGGIEATAFQRLPKRAWDGLAGEAAALLAFLADREPTIYRRYARWWATLPEGDVRLLGR